MILDRALAQEDLEAEQDHRIRKGIEKVLDKVAEGDLPSIQLLADRTDGKPAQQIELGNTDGQPFVLKVEAQDVNL